MAPRQRDERASLESRSNRGQIHRRLNRWEGFIDNGEFQYAQGPEQYGKSYRPRYDQNGDPMRRTGFENELKKDLAATKRVWQMISCGAARMLNRVSRKV